MHVDPAARRARDDRALQAVPLGGGEVVGDSRPQLFRLDQRQLVRVAPLVQRLALERLADELLEVVHRVHRRAIVPTTSAHFSCGSSWPCSLVEPLPAGARGGLGVEDQAVEVEEECADGHGDAEYARGDPGRRRRRDVHGRGAARGRTRADGEGADGGAAGGVGARRCARGRRGERRPLRARDDRRDERAARAARRAHRVRRERGLRASAPPAAADARAPLPAVRRSIPRRSSRSSAATACAGGSGRTASSSRSISSTLPDIGDARPSRSACSSRSATRRTSRRSPTSCAAAIPGVHVVASHEVAPEFREYERASTTAADAYLAPVAARYLRALADERARPRVCRSRS